MRGVIILSFFLTGCSGGCEKTKNLVGLSPSEDPEVVKQRLVEEKKQKEQQLKEADSLVQKWADQLSVSAGNGFSRQEGLLELDPWGNSLRIDYRQEWFEEVMVVRSSGPDGKYDTVDDLVRTRRASNPGGILSGISGWCWFLIIWVFTGILSFCFAAGVGHNRKSRGKGSRHKNPVGFVIATILFAPLMMMIYGLQYVGGVLGVAGEFFDGFDFDFD